MTTDPKYAEHTPLSGLAACTYCGNYHNYSVEMCKDQHNRPVAPALLAEVQSLRAEVERQNGELTECGDTAKALRAEVVKLRGNQWTEGDRHAAARLIGRAETAEADLARVTKERDDWMGRHDIAIHDGMRHAETATKAEATIAEFVSILSEAVEGKAGWINKADAAIDKARGRKGEGT